MRPPSVAKAGHALRQALRSGAGELLLLRPIYDAWRHLKNADARQLYRAGHAELVPTPLEQSIIERLRQDGIAIVQLNDLLSEPSFAQIREWAESLLAAPAVQERIASVLAGAKPQAKSGKYFVVRPLGEPASLNTGDLVVKAALSEPILRIVCGYLGMLPRISALDLWYHVALSGPEIFSQRWHRDPEDRALIKTFLYLHDCADDNGPFCFVPGTHRAKLPRPHTVGRDNYPKASWLERNIPLERQQSCTGRAGTLIFCDTTGFHKGGHVLSGSRFVFNTVYTSNASEPVARGWRPCRLTGSAESLGLAARYAVGHLQAESSWHSWRRLVDRHLRRAPQE